MAPSSAPVLADTRVHRRGRRFSSGRYAGWRRFNDLE
jgi:hypothetical protein